MEQRFTSVKFGLHFNRSLNCKRFSIINHFHLFNPALPLLSLIRLLVPWISTLFYPQSPSILLRLLGIQRQSSEAYLCWLSVPTSTPIFLVYSTDKTATATLYLFKLASPHYWFSVLCKDLHYLGFGGFKINVKIHFAPFLSRVTDQRNGKVRSMSVMCRGFWVSGQQLEES